MESQYYEHLVKCKSPIVMQAVKVCSIAAFLISLLFIIPFSLIPGIAGCVLMAVFFWISTRETGKEYEYVYIDGDISFDVVYCKSKRKCKEKVTWEEIKRICPADALELEGYRQHGAKQVYFISGANKADEKVYALVVQRRENEMLIFFDAAPEMLEMMWRKSPSKVKR